jgi:outer membrane cobalamin receptor
MKKRGFFSLVLVLASLTMLAAQDYTDIGTAYGLVVADEAFSEAETNSASSVTIITAEDIAAYNADSFADLVEMAIGTTVSSYGGLGAAQSIKIRGASSNNTLIYIDGVQMNTAHDSSFDSSLIPLSLIDHIEIIKSGTGNLSKTNAIGGIVNIITKKGTETETPFTLTVENGSYLPQAYGTDGTRNWASLVDSQKIDLSYGTRKDGTGIQANIGGIVAQNEYTYADGDSRALRENAGVSEAYGSFGIDKKVGENITIQSNNTALYKELETPGSIYYLTPDDYQNDLFLSTSNKAVFSNLESESLEQVTASLFYEFNETDVLSSGTTSDHKKQRASILVEQKWEPGENTALTTGFDGSLDYIDSTDVGEHLRITPSFYANQAIFLPGDRLSLYPSASLAYVSDKEALSPNGSLGMIYVLSEPVSLKATVAYAERVPSFSDLYWTDTVYNMYGNPDLETEKGMNGEIGIEYKNTRLSYTGSLYARDIYDAISWTTDDYSSWYTENIDHSLYFGTEQGIEWQIDPAFSVQASYQYNKSFDISDATIWDNVEVSSVRKHTAKLTTTYRKDNLTAMVSGSYYGEATDLDAVFLVDLSVTVQVSRTVEVSAAIDNLFNTTYYLDSWSSYPMPGTKVRLGASWRF